MFNRQSNVIFVLTAIAVLAAAKPSVAMVISGGENPSHLSAPTDDPGWARVGRVGTNGSGVYLGNGWIITAAHVSSKTYFTVDGDATYYKLEGSEYGVQLRTPSDTGYTDLYMFRVDVSAGELSSFGEMPIISASISANTQLVHIGTGLGQTSSSETTWYVDTSQNPYRWETHPFAGFNATAQGYYWANGTRDTRWSYQDVYDDDFDFSVLGMPVEGFATDFKDQDGYGMAANNDSGSGLFVQIGDEWHLGGIVHSVLGFSGQPSSTSVYGNLTVCSDLSAYGDQIADIIAIPEPVTLGLFAVGSLFITTRRRDGYKL